MAYITQEDLLDELGERTLIELTDDTGSGEIAEQLVSKAIEFAVGAVESYLRTRYTLPVPSTQFIKSTCVTFAVYKLYAKRATFADDGVFKVKKIAYDEAMARLKDIAAGRAALDIPATEETIETPASGDQILTNARNTKFSGDNLKGY